MTRKEQIRNAYKLSGNLLPGSASYGGGRKRVLLLQEITEAKMVREMHFLRKAGSK